MPFDRLTGFADEIEADFDAQLRTLNALGVAGIDLRNADGKHVLALSADELRGLRTRAEAAGCYFSTIGSPVNKVDFTPDNESAEFEKLKLSIEAAHYVGTDRIRLFTPEVPEHRWHEETEGVMQWMERQIELAQSAGIVLLHENDARFWGAIPQNSEVLFDRLGGPYFRAAFDFANTVLIGFRPFHDWFPWILPHLDTLHIKDAIDGRVVAAGQGNGQIVATLRYLNEAGWDGPLTLEPHLSAAGAYGGFSGPDLFRVATEALRECIAEALRD